MENTEILNKILELEKENEIVFMTESGLMTSSIEKIIKQPIEGLLYDLNRDKTSLMTMVNSKSLRWVNDMALVNVLKYVLDKLNDSNSDSSKHTTSQPSIEKTNIGAGDIVPGFNTNLSISL